MKEAGGGQTLELTQELVENGEGSRRLGLWRVGEGRRRLRLWRVGEGRRRLGLLLCLGQLIHEVGSYRVNQMWDVCPGPGGV